MNLTNNFDTPVGPSYYISPGEELDLGTNGDIGLSDNREDRGLDAPKDDAGNPTDEGESNKGINGVKPSSKRHYVIYGLEIGLSIVVGIMMITTNALLSKLLSLSQSLVWYP